MQQSEWYRDLFPEVADLAYDQNTKSHFKNTKGGSRYACTVGGSVTGMHGHFLIIDDPLDPKGARSDADLLSTNEWMEETLPSRKVDKSVSVMILIMQRLHQNDPSGAALTKFRSGKGGKIKHICLPAELTPNVRPRSLRKHYVDGLMDPVRLSKEVLAVEASSSDYVYASQFLQTPIPPSGGMFKVNRFKFEIPEPLKHFQKVIRYTDKAGTDGGKGAYTAGVKMGRDRQGRLFILDVWRDRLDAGDREIRIKAVAETDDAQSFPKKTTQGIEQEPGSAGKESAQNTTRNLEGHTVWVDRPTGAKEERADPLATQVNQGLVYIALNPDGTKPVWWEAYKEEFSYFPFSTHKDQVDGSTGAFKGLTAKKGRAGRFGKGKRTRGRSR